MIFRISLMFLVILLILKEGILIIRWRIFFFLYVERFGIFESFGSLLYLVRVIKELICLIMIMCVL